MTEEKGQHSPDQENTPLTHRVKLYQLNVDTNWEDKGTGNCIYQLGTDEKPDQIVVQSEEDDSILLTSNVIKRHLYQRQQDTLIVWTEDDNRDLALSFQDPIGCEEIWQCIMKKQEADGALTTRDLGNDALSSPVRDSPEVVSLPDPELSNLKGIAETLNAAHTLHEKDKISAFVLTENYIEKLFPLFEICEDLEAIVDLNHLYNVLIGILTLNNQRIIKQLVRDEYIFGLMGILEYNPNTPGMKARHVEFIKSKGNAKQMIEMIDEAIVRKIDHTFRLEYLQDILLNSTSDEGLMGVMSNIISSNHTDIVNYIQNNHTFLQELFKVIRNKDTTYEKRLETIRFVHQLCNLTKQRDPNVRVNLFRTLATHGLFDLFCYSLEDKDKVIRSNSLNVLAAFTDLDVASVRNTILATSKENHVSKPLTEVIVEQFTKNDDFDLKVQYFEILKLLLDPNGNSMAGGGGLLTSDPLSKQTPETDEFLTLFYDKYITLLLQPIESLDIKPMLLKGPIIHLELTNDQAQLCLYICEFLTFAVRNHGFRSKYILLSSNLFLKVAQLYRSKYAYIKLVALRFFRICVSISDEFYNRSLTKHNIFEPTIRVLLDTNGQDCLLTSACLDLLEYIRKENIKSLVSHLITQFGTVLDTITYISTCKQLRLKYEQNNEPKEAGNNSGSNPDEGSLSERSDKKTNHDGWSSSTIDDDEEEYFNASDEEDTTADEQPRPTQHILKPTAPLVSYEDDDYDEDEEKTEQQHQSKDTVDTKEKDALEEEKKQEKSQLVDTNNTIIVADAAANTDVDATTTITTITTTTTTTTTTTNTDTPDITEKMDINEERAAAKRKIEEAAHETKDASNKQENIEDVLSPPPFKSRKKDQDEDEDDVLAKKRTSPRQSPSLSPKKIVIKTSTIKKMRTSSQ